MEHNKINETELTQVSGAAGQTNTYVFYNGETIWGANKIRYIKVNEDVSTDRDDYEVSVTQISTSPMNSPVDLMLTTRALQELVSRYGIRS